jgi:hypothetical protein
VELRGLESQTERALLDLDIATLEFGDTRAVVGGKAEDWHFVCGRP